MTEYEVDCVTLGAPHEYVKYIGGPSHDRTRWWKSLGDAIKLIKGGDKFFVIVGGNKTELKIYPREGKEFLRTERDNTPLDNLDNLSRPCPK